MSRAKINTTIRRWCERCYDFTTSDTCGLCLDEICVRCGCDCDEDGDTPW